MIKIDWVEKDIEDYLCKPIDNFKRTTKITDISGCENFVIIGRQVKILNFIIDILAYDTINKNFFILELKKNNIDINAYMQALKYLKILQAKHLKNNINILLIGQNLDENLYYTVNRIVTYSGVEKNEVFYSLYAVDFEHGIDFNYYNVHQEKIRNNLKEIYTNVKNKKIEVYNKGVKNGSI